MSDNAAEIVAFPESEVSILEAYLRGLPTEATRGVYRRAVKGFEGFLGRRDRLTATRRDVEAYRAHLEAIGRAPSTIGRALSALSGFYGFAVDEGVVDRNPAASARRPRLPRESPRQGLSPAEVGALLKATEGERLINLRDRALVLVLAVQALRVSEALGLTLEDLGEEAGHKVAVVHGKGGKVVRVPLAAVVYQAISEWTEAAEITTGPVFLAVTKGGDVVPGKAISPSSAWRRVRYLGRRADLGRRVHPHLFRHGACTAALDAGVRLRYVQDLLRHSDPRTTRRYDSHRLSLANPAPHVLASVLASSE